MAAGDYDLLDMTYLNVDSVRSPRSILRADYGDGYADTAIVGALGGRKQFTISSGVWPDSEDQPMIGAQTIFEYYWSFFEDHLDAGNEPFRIEWRDRQWLVDLSEPVHGIAVHTSDLFTPEGLTLNLRRVRGIDVNTDGSIAGPPVPTGLIATALSGTEILLEWDAPPDVEAPTAPVLVSATADSSSEITIVWDAATDNVGVTGYETRIDGGSWVDRGNVLTYQYTGLSSSTEYDFEVRAYDAAENFSVESNLISETTDSGPVTPIALVASLLEGSGTGNTFTSGAIDSTGATLLVVAASWSTAAGGGTLTDSKGNTWVGLTAKVASFSIQIYYVKNPTVGSGHTFTWTAAGADLPTLGIMAFDETDITANADGENGSAPGVITTIQPGSVTPSVDNCVLVTALTGAGAGPTIDSSFTVIDAEGFVGGQHSPLAIAYKVQTTAGAENPTWTTNVGFGTDNCAVIAAFKHS